MFSKKEVFESYVGKLGLNKTALEAVKNINGVLFEGIDDELEEFNDDVSETPSEDIPPVDIAQVNENIDGDVDASSEPVEPSEEVGVAKESASPELAYLKKVPFHTAYQEARDWASREPRFDDLWNNYRGIDSVSFMVPSEDGPLYYNEETVPYEISVEGEGAVPKYDYETATNHVKMSKELHDVIMQYFEEHGHEGIVDLCEIPFIDIKRLIQGNGVHRTGEEAPHLDVNCTFDVDPSAVLLSTKADNREVGTDVITPNVKVREELKKEYGLPVESLFKALFKEWTAANPSYIFDENTGIIYDSEKKALPNQISDKDLNKLANPFRKKKETVSTMKLVDWAKTQDMFKLLLKPNSYGVRNLVETGAIYKVPNDGTIEGVSPNATHVYMDDNNYESYVKSNPSIDLSSVEKLPVGKLNDVISEEYEAAMGNADKSGSNAYGYDENGWVNNIDCEKVEGKYALTQNAYLQIRGAYGKNAKTINYIAGKNVVDVNGVKCHPLVRLARTNGGFLRPRLVAVFDDTCCSPAESIKKVVGETGFDGPRATISGYAIICDGCDLGKTGEFDIRCCALSNVNIRQSVGYIKIGAEDGAPSRTTVSNTTIAIGNNDAGKLLPNNQVAAETVDGIRGVQIVNSNISNSTIENGYAKLLNCTLTNLKLTNSGVKDITDWHSKDASNVEFVGGNKITITGNAIYKVGWHKGPMGKSYPEYKSGNVKTELIGRVVLDASAGNVTCSGTKLTDVIANGPCKLRTCDLAGTTIGANSDAQGNFKMTDMTGVSSNGAVQIEHGVYRGTVLGRSDTDRGCGKITLTGRVRIEGGAQIFNSHIYSADDSQCTCVRSNMRLEDCPEYSLNEKDSGILSMSLREDSTLRGVCTNLAEVERKSQIVNNTYGGAGDIGTPTAKYEQFKAGDTGDSLRRLNFYDANTLVEDFLQNTSSILMDKSVFMDFTDDGQVVPNENLKKTIWDPIGAFFVGAVNRETFGSMILLKCPNVVLNHQAILQKKHEFGQDIDYKTYASGAITLRQYVNFLEKNGYTDCFQYVDGKFGKEFVQLCYINPKTKTPYKISLEQMETLCDNDKSKRYVQEFLNTDSSVKRISEVDTYDSITSAYTDNIGTLYVEIDGGRRKYTYAPPRVNDSDGVIQSECTKEWYGADNKKERKTYPVNCGKDAMYRYAYEYMIKHGGSNANALSKMNAALSGNTDGMGQVDYTAHAINSLKGKNMQSNAIDLSTLDPVSQIKRKLNLKPKEDLYFLQRPAFDNSNECLIVVGTFPRLNAEMYRKFDNRGCDAMTYHKVSYSPEDDTFNVSKTGRTVAVKNRDKPKPTLVPSFKDYLLYRKADIKDFEYLLNYPAPKVEK